MRLASAAWLDDTGRHLGRCCRPLRPLRRSTFDAARRENPRRASFLRLAHSSAVLQSSAAQLVASREARPEARAFAQLMVEFRREQIPKLEAAARDHQLAVPSVQEFEHQVILENLQPLDFLALSRRYAEIQVQALEQELRGFTSAESSPNDWLKNLANETRPRLQHLLDEARQMQKAVGP